MLRVKRKSILLMILLLLLSQVSCLSRCIGGAHNFMPGTKYAVLSPGAQELIIQAFNGIEARKLMDYHVHMVATGTTCKECFVHPHFYSALHPIKRMRFKVYASAAGITDFSRTDDQYLERLNHLIDNMETHGRFLVLAFDKHYTPDGQPDLSQTDFYLSNDYVFEAAAKSKHLIPAVSVHPARKDAVAELERVAKKGARVVKWLPNAMGIRPSDPAYRAYYETMKKHNMILLSHAGEERAVDADEYQELGNPLYLRYPLDLGVKVIVAHCASLGKAKDLDAPGQPLVSNFELFLRLFAEKKYEGRLFADISAMTQFNRLGATPEPEPLKHVLAHPELHKRLVNGSDYPLPAINIVIRTKSLLKNGFITEKEREHLNEIYNFNPLLFDFVVKRTLHHPEHPEWKLLPEVFLERKELRPFQ
jgi:predicted TIM-barrel fold metal-dependent hydrolase